MKRVLIVDDEPSLREVVGAALTGEGYDCRLAADALEARQIAQTWPPHVAVVDVAMPFEDGTSLAVWLHQTVPGCRVILYSAKPNMGEIKRLGAEFGAAAVIAKPFELLKLLDTVASVMGHG